MKELNLKHEAKRYGCAVLAATIMALNIKTFVRAGGLFPGGFTGLTLLLQNIFQTFMGIAVPYTLINVLLNSIPVFIGLKFIGKKFTISSVCVIVLSVPPVLVLPIRQRLMQKPLIKPPKILISNVS